LENWGSVIADATSALALDESLAKAHYRRACAYLGIAKLKEAKNDFAKCAKLAPQDKNARTKLKECQKELKKQAFADAISGDHDIVLLSSTMNLDEMNVDDSYDGPRIPNPPTRESVIEMMAWFKEQKNIHKKYCYQMLIAMRELLAPQPSLNRISVPEGHHITVCGDTHGQYYDLCNIFEIGGMPSEENPYVFNGDYVDRGSFSAEVALTLMAWKLVYPEHMHLHRGNHETINMNKVYGFEGEVNAKYGEKGFTLFTEVFNVLPLASCIAEKVIVMHGGLFQQDNVTLDMIAATPRDKQPPDDGIMCDILWADPQEPLGRGPSKRGVGLAFGPDVTTDFLDRNGLQMVVRSHEVKDNGYEITHDGKLVTVFSAPNYCDQMGNKDAFIRFNHECTPEYTTFDSVPHPAIRPMAYASSFGNMFGQGQFGM